MRFWGKVENFFDQLDDALNFRKAFRTRLNDPDWGKLFREELHLRFDKKVKDKRLGGMRRQAQTAPWLAGILVAMYVISILRKKPWHPLFVIVVLVGGLAAIAYGYFSAVYRLYAPLKEADREASAVIYPLTQQAEAEVETTDSTTGPTTEASSAPPPAGLPDDVDLYDLYDLFAAQAAEWVD